MISILDSEVHARLIADLDHICEVAGVQQNYIHQPMKDFCTIEEISWVKNFNLLRGAVPGLMLAGGHKPEVRCQSIAAALLRNFIDARVVPFQLLVEQHKAGHTMNPTVMLIPNLFSQGVLASSVPAWQVQIVYDILMQRAVYNKPSVVYVQNLAECQKSFGANFVDFLKSFKVVIA